MVQLLYGTQRERLRQDCLNQVAAHMHNWPDRRAVMLVPEQGKMEMERDFLNLPDQPSLMMADVLSFRRLAWRLLGEVGAQPRQTVDAVGQAILIQRILRLNQDELRLFSQMADRPGFVRHVASVLGDFRRYQVNAETLRQAAETCGDDALKVKINDFAVISAAYDQALIEHDLGDSEDDLLRLSELLNHLQSLSQPWSWPWNRLSWLRQTSFWISGFGELRSFTPQEMAIIAGLDQLAHEIHITVAADRLPADHEGIQDGSDFFLPGRRTAWQLVAQLPVTRHRLIRPDQINAGDIAGSLLINHIREPLSPDIIGSLAALPPLSDDPAGQAEPRQMVNTLKDWLRLTRMTDPDQEIRWVAGEIRRLVQTEDYRYRDIVIAVCQPASDYSRLRLIFREYGLPVYLDADRSLNGTPLMRLVISLLDIELTGWSRQAVMSYLRTGLSSTPPEAIDQLENHWLAWNLFRSDRLFDARYDTRERGLAPELASLRDQLLLPVRDMLKQLRRARAGTEKCRLLQAWLIQQGLDEKTRQRIDRLVQSGDMENAVTLAQSWNELDHVLEQMIHLHADEPLSLQAFRDHLAAGIDAARLSLIPTAADQVSIGDLRRAMLRRPKILFVIGASAVQLPPAWPPEGLLKDQERQVLAQAIEKDLPSHVTDQAFADSFMIYSLMTAPSCALYLTLSDPEASPWFRWLAEWFPGQTVNLPASPGPGDSRLNASGPAFSALIRAGSSVQGLTPVERDGWLELASLLRDDDQLPWQQLAGWQQDLASGRYGTAARIRPDRLAQMHQGRILLSVSQLEQYASCPFRNLALSLLRLRERPVWQPQATDIGLVLHDIAEQAMSELRRAIEALPADDREGRERLYRQWLNQNFDQAVRGWLDQAKTRYQQLSEKGLQASVTRRIGRLASASLQMMISQLSRESYQPALLEWFFGPGQPERFAILQPGLPDLELRGVIDRVDVSASESGDQFRIIDYKSGSQTVDFDRLYHGLDLQLPLYLAAYQASHHDQLAADAAYFHFDRPVLAVTAAEADDPQSIRAQLERKGQLVSYQLPPDLLSRLSRHSQHQAALLGRQMQSGEYSARPVRLQGRPLPCEWCQMQALCRHDGSPSACRWLQPIDQLIQPQEKLTKRQRFSAWLSEQMEDQV